MNAVEQAPSPQLTFWQLPPSSMRLAVLPLCDILCEATLLLSDVHFTGIRHVYIAKGGLWYSAVRTTQTGHDRRIRRWADLGQASVQSFQQVTNREFSLGLSLTSISNAGVDLYFPNEALLDLWLSKLQLFCRLHNFQEDFRLLYKLGSGQFGTVFAALEYSSSLIYAVKIVSRSQRKEIDHEMAILKELKLASVPQVRKMYEDPCKISLVMHLSAGLDVRSYLSRFGPLPEALARKVVFSLTRTLSLVHQHGIIHRDVKPENVLIDIRHKREVSSVSLVDFGLAIHCDQARAGSCSGTAGYLAPEVLQLQLFDCKADVFSLGVFTYTLLAGECPFASSTMQRIAYLNSRCRLSFAGGIWRHVSKDCLAFIAALACLEPGKRPTAAEALELPWLSGLQHQFEELSLAKVRKENTSDSIASTQPEEANSINI